jgi:hypothetical protein
VSIVAAKVAPSTFRPGVGYTLFISSEITSDEIDRQNLPAKLALTRELGLARADFYHYGLMRLEALDLIRSALEA